mmetsp:Transcript_29820/g.59566  ORF Transcript_29820/g.59566 Transcript_29820/m.59566 type:complete len:193 (-) Transcript_29820:703-1281(-)
MFRLSISFIAVFAILLSAALPLVSGVHTRVEDAKIMAEKSMEEGVVVTPSGLLYKELRPGKQDGMKPGHFEPCTMRWHNGTLIDKVTKPRHQDTPDNIIIRRRPSELIPGWAEALQRSEPVFSLIQQKGEDKIQYLRHNFSENSFPVDTLFPLSICEMLSITLFLSYFPPPTEQRKVQWSRYMFRHFWDTVI